MKRIAAILTSLVLVFSLAACGSQQAGTAAGSEAASTASSETASAAQTKTEEQLLAFWARTMNCGKRFLPRWTKM